MNFTRTPFTAKSALSLLMAFSLAFGAAMVVSSGEAEAAWSCVPYARQVSTVSLKGDAWQWWNAATGVYAKGHTPKPGAVLVFKRTGEMRRGHVAVVRQVVNSRKIIVDHANWSRKGGIDHSVAIIDVSAHNDWSQTRVWYAPIHDFGDGSHPTYGFIYAPSKATMKAAVVVSEDNGVDDENDADMAAPANGKSPHLIQANYELPPQVSRPAAAAAVSAEVTGFARHKVVLAKVAPLPDRRPVMVSVLLSGVVDMLAQDASLHSTPLPTHKPSL